MRLFAVSDIHIDYDENRQWLNQLSRSDYTEDILLLGGDISDSLPLIEESFAVFTERFQQVAFVPGNHDIWIKSSDFSCSIDKFHHLLQLAKIYQIQTESFQIRTTQIVPMFSWYDFSFGEPSATLTRSWMDFYRCRWPDTLDSSALINDYFLQLNNEICLNSSAEKVVSFSHFLPRIDVMPARIPQKHRLVYPVLGSQGLDQQVRQLQSNIHVYGHSHVNVDVKLDNVRYVNSAIGYPSEFWNSKHLKLILPSL